MVLLALENITFTYPESERPSLTRIDLEVHPGESVLIAGPSGSGKSTLLRIFNGLVPHLSGGSLSGRYAIGGENSRDFSASELAARCGMVFQDPEKQLVMTTVESELAFGLENAGVSQQEMKRRVEEMLIQFDFFSQRQRPTWELSGGEKQKLAIAGATVTGPDVLLLDEPTSQLDPVASDQVIGLVRKLNEETGITVLLAEHRLEKCLPWVDRVLYMEAGSLVFQGTPGEFVAWAKEDVIPSLPRCFRKAGFAEPPLTVKEAIRRGADKTFELAIRPDTTKTAEGEPVLSARKLGFFYDRSQIPVFRDLNLSVAAGQTVAVIGGNGAGKSTLLKLFCGVLEPSAGAVEKRVESTGYLSQNPNDHLMHETLEEELTFTQQCRGFRDDSLIDEVLDSLGLQAFRHWNPRDLSGGERQRAALATVLAGKPDALLLDEPTRGMDAAGKRRLGARVRREAESGKAVIVVTHDMEFVAAFADRVILLSGGSVIADGSPREVLHGGLYYTTSLNRCFRKLGPALTENDVVYREGEERMRFGRFLHVKTMALVSALAAIAAAGRVAFAALPSVQPTTFVIIVSGWVLGPVMGGIVGALAALVSNFFLMQGPWTPFQMLAWGAAGLASGVLGKWWKDPPAVLLAVYGAAWGYLFGWAMNLWFWLTMVYPHTFSSWVAANASSFLFDTAHAVGNFLFCWLAGPMMLKVLRRFQKRFAVRIVEHEESEMTEVKSK